VEDVGCGCQMCSSWNGEMVLLGMVVSFGEVSDMGQLCAVGGFDRRLDVYTKEKV